MTGKKKPRLYRGFLRILDGALIGRMPESKRLRGGIARPIPGARPTACFATKIIPDDFVEPR